MRTNLAGLAMILTMAPVLAEPPLVRESGHASSDIRLGAPKTLDDHFPFQVPENGGEWHERSELLRRRVLVANGLWPMPEKTPLKPVIFGKSSHDGFTVEKVYFESLPGHFVTGLLFRPSKPSTDRSAGVLCPHGHGGRMQRFSDEEIDAQIAQGAEHFRDSGRTPKLARCVQLARMGCVTFIFDMLGYADSVQISQQVAHRHKDSRPEELQPTESGWLFYSPEADQRLQSIMGLQTWNSIRALDFLESLPDVDAECLAVTGGSGGGTQSILLGAIDDRIKVSFPNGMVSTSMQGGCYCENCNLLRVDTGNVELAALFAPRPQAMTAADDWTRHMMSDGYPELKWLYAMVGNEDDVYCRPMLHFKHNYNYVTRATMYQWMNRHLKLGLDDPVIEQDSTPLTESETTVWNEEHPRPSEVGMEHERSICRWFDQQSRQGLEATIPNNNQMLDSFRQAFGGAWRIIFDQGIPQDVLYLTTGEEIQEGIRVSKGLLQSPSRGAELPLLTLRKESIDVPRSVVIWTTDKGKESAFDEAGKPSDGLRKMLDRGSVVLLADLMGQGEWGGQEHASGQRLVEDERSYSAFTFGYNRTLVAERCADLLLVVAHALQLKGKSAINGNVTLLSTDQSVAWAAPAAALAGSAIDRAAIVSNGFRFAEVRSYQDPHFVPGAVKYGDIPALLALRAPHPLMVLGEPEMPDIATKAFSAAGANSQALHRSAPELGDTVLTWLFE